MKHILENEIKDFGALQFLCDCGQIHQTDVCDIVVEENAISQLPFFVKKFGKKALLVFECDVLDKIGETFLKDFSKTFESQLIAVNKLTTPQDMQKNSFDFDNRVVVAVGGQLSSFWGKRLACDCSLPFLQILAKADGDVLFCKNVVLFNGTQFEISEGVSPNVVLADLDLIEQFSSTSQIVDVVSVNLLTTFEYHFNSIVYAQKYCKEIAFQIKMEIKNVLCFSNEEREQLSFKRVANAFLKVSLLKSLVNGKDFLTSFDSMFLAIYSKLIEADSTSLRTGLFEIMVRYFQVFLNTDTEIFFPKNWLKHRSIAKKVFNITLKNKEGKIPCKTLYTDNVETFKKNIGIVGVLLPLILPATTNRIEMDVDLMIHAMIVSTDICPLLGVLEYMNAIGALDRF